MKQFPNAYENNIIHIKIGKKIFMQKTIKLLCLINCIIRFFILAQNEIFEGFASSSVI